MFVLVLLFGWMSSAFSQNEPRIDEITLSTGRSVTLEVLHPTKISCAPATNRCEIRVSDLPGAGEGKVVLFVNHWQVTPTMSHRELLVEYKAFRDAGICP